MQTGLHKDDGLYSDGMTWKEISVSTDSTECSCLRIELLLSAFVRERICERLAFAVYKLRG